MEDLFETIEKLGEDLHIADIFYAIGGAIVWALNMLAEFKDSLEEEGSFKDFVKALVDQNRVLSWIKDKWEGLKKTLDDLFNRRITLSQALGLDKLKEQFAFLTPIIEHFKEHYKSIFEAYEGEEGKEGLPFIQKFGDRLKQAIKNLKWEDIYGLIGASFFAYWKVKSVEIQSYIAETFGRFHDTFQKLADGVTLSLNKMTKETNAEKILKIAAGIALLAASVFLLGTMDPQGLEQGIKYLGAILIAITAMVGILGLIMKTTKNFEKEYEIEKKGAKERSNKKTSGLFKKNIFEVITERVKESFEYGKETVEQTIKDLSDIPMLILALGASVFLIVSALSKLTKSFQGMTKVQLDSVVKILVLTFIGLGAIVGALAWYTSKHKDDMDAETINAMSKMFLLLAIAVRLIIGAISSLAIVMKFAGANVLIATGIVVGIAAGLYFIASQLTQIASKHHGGYKNLLSVGAVLIAIAAAIQMLIIPIAALAALMAIPGVGAGKVVGAATIVVVIMGLMAGMAVAMGKLLKDIEIAGVLSGASAMVIMAAALNMMIIPIAAITAIAATDPNALGEALIVIGIVTAVMAAIIALFAFMGQSGLGSAGMLAGGLAMVMIASGIQKMALALAGLTVLESKFPGGIAVFFEDLAKGLAMLCSVKVQTGLWLTSVALLVLGGGMLMFGAGALAFGIGAKSAAEAVLFFVSARSLFLFSLFHIQLQASLPVVSFLHHYSE